MVFRTLLVLVIVCLGMSKSQAVFAGHEEDEKKVIEVPLNPKRRLVPPAALPLPPIARPGAEAPKKETDEEKRVRLVREEMNAFSKMIADYRALDTDFKAFPKVPEPWKTALLDPNSAEKLEAAIANEINLGLEKLQKDRKFNEEQIATYRSRSLEARRMEMKRIYRAEIKRMAGVMNFDQLFRIRHGFVTARQAERFDLILADNDAFSINDIQNLLKDAVKREVRLPNSPIEARSDEESGQRELHQALRVQHQRRASRR